MPLTIILTDINGPATVYSSTANGDGLFVMQGVLAATDSTVTAINILHDNVSVRIDGLVVAASMAIDSFFTNGFSLSVGAGGAIVSHNPDSNDACVSLGKLSSLENLGEISALTAIGVVVVGGGAEIYNAGTIGGTSGVQLGVLGGSASTLTNAGSIVARGRFDGDLSIFEGRGVLIEQSDATILNMAGGRIVSLVDGGSGISTSPQIVGQHSIVVRNDGEIAALRGIAVDFSHMGNGGDTLLRNSGTITGRTIAYAGGTGPDRVINSGLMDGDLVLGEGADTYRGLERGIVLGAIAGGIGDDVLSGGDVAETLDGGTDNDTLQGGGGDDSLIGGAGHDVLRGNDGVDNLRADAGNDVLFGGAGDDTINGGAGRDVMAGGDGADDFVFFQAVHSGLAALSDVIRDFTPGQDVIDLELVNTGVLTFVGTGPFTGGGTASVAVTTNAASTFVHVDNDGNNSADMRIVLNGVLALTAADFVL